MGGPWTLADVKPFLRAVLGDRQVIRFPGGAALQPLWARALATLRAGKVRLRYAAIGGGSPLLEHTERQARALARRLDGAPVEVAMRYSAPRADQALRALLDRGCTRVVALSLYPQRCGATTDSSFADLERALAGRAEEVELVPIRAFHDHPGYLRALAATVGEALDELNEAVRASAVVLFSAHGVPERLVAAGDPYVDQVRATVAGVVAELGDALGEHRLSFQSRVGPVRWVGPHTDAVVEQLGRGGTRALVVVPVSFVSDHIETLHELDIELAALARASGVTHFVRAPALGDRPAFVDALATLVEEALG
jgi:ferrochelatase